METAPTHNPTDGYLGTTTVPWIDATTSQKKNVGLYPNFDSVDDAAVWIHPIDPSKSLIINVDKSDDGGFNLYNLNGSEHGWVSTTASDPSKRLNNVDIRYNFPLDGQSVALVGFSVRDKVNPRLAFYRVDPATRTLVHINSPATSTAQGIMPRGFAMYHSPNTGKYYAFVTDSGKTDQYELDGSTGTVKLTLVSTGTAKVPTTDTSTEGLVADDEYGYLYVAEEKNSADPPETVGHIWRFNADPGPRNQTEIAAAPQPAHPEAYTGTKPKVTPDIKGLTIYYASGGKGYLISASQGKEPGQNYSAFGVFDRKTGAYKGSFAVIGSSCPTDAAANEDGIDVTNFNLGPSFPNGIFITGDFDNTDGSTLMRQNNKVVSWTTIANAFSPALVIDNTWDPRAVGAAGGGGGGGGGGPTPGTSILSVPASGGTPSIIAAPVSGSYRDPAYSIGRGRIAFAGPSGIVIAKANGTAQQALSGTVGARHPAWGPRNRYVFYVKRGALYRRAVGGTTTRRMVASRVLWVAASPNGSKVAFQRRGSNGRSDIWVMTAAGAGLRNLTASSSRSEVQPSWANGTTVAFAAVVKGRWVVLRRSTGGGPVRAVTRRSLNCQQPAYAPGGARLVCLRVGNSANVLVTLSANGTGAVQVATTSTKPIGPTWAGASTVTYAAK